MSVHYGGFLINGRNLLILETELLWLSFGGRGLRGWQIALQRKCGWERSLDWIILHPYTAGVWDTCTGGPITDFSTGFEVQLLGIAEPLMIPISCLKRIHTKPSL